MVATLPVFVCTFVCNPKGVISPLISPANPLQGAEVSSQGQLLGTARYLVPGSRTICHSCYKILKSCLKPSVNNRNCGVFCFVYFSPADVSPPAVLNTTQKPSERTLKAIQFCQRHPSVGSKPKHLVSCARLLS